MVWKGVLAEPFRTCVKALRSIEASEGGVALLLVLVLWRLLSLEICFIT